eukprot:TRINITY_DN50716_c0_g1_i1.p1 TRINITY_DN50716_c0_g1~~TRINITY_DN50716_c0_g1_i1.p1  ORF type:complete len:422 (+),score=99.37 TRINITY_DN50716_c0_g1_i1:41-1267(+)
MSLWADVVRSVMNGDCHISELAWTVMGKYQRAGRQRQFAACRCYCLLLRWICGIMKVAVPMKWLELVGSVVEISRCAGHAKQLLELLEDLPFLDDASAALRSQLTAGKLVIPRHCNNSSGVSGPGPGGSAAASDDASRSTGAATGKSQYFTSVESEVVAPLQPFMLESEPLWIEDAAGLEEVSETLQKMAKEAEAERSCIWVALDSEWGAKADRLGPSSAPSICQISACWAISAAGSRKALGVGTLLPQTWIIDVENASKALGDLLKWMLDKPNVRLLGFAFRHDAQRLGSLIPIPEAADLLLSKVNDLQRSLMSTASVEADGSKGSGGYHGGGGSSKSNGGVINGNGGSAGDLPSLRKATEALLGLSLNKSEQCSDWDLRPLSSSQLHYAAADAAVLLKIASALRCT